MIRTAKQAALSLLARREHSTQELVNKLQQRGYDADVIVEVIDGLQACGLQSDQRFAEMFIRARAARGYGPVWIKQRLNGLGVSDALIAEGLAVSAIDWAECARHVVLKKFGDQWCADAKQQRFLQYRGFASEQIRGLQQSHSMP